MLGHHDQPLKFHKSSCGVFIFHGWTSQPLLPVWKENVIIYANKKERTSRGGGAAYIEWKIVGEKYLLQTTSKLHAFPPPKLIHFHANQTTNNKQANMDKKLTWTVTNCGRGLRRADQFPQSASRLWVHLAAHSLGFSKMWVRLAAHTTAHIGRCECIQLRVKYTLNLK